MRKLVLAVVGLLTLMAIMFNATAKANLIINGGFENGVGTGIDAGQIIDGWSRSGNVGRVDAFGGPIFDGDFSAAFNFGNTPSDGVLSQSFPTVADATYLLSFTHGMNGNANTQTLGIQLDGAGGAGSLLDTSIDVTKDVGNNFNWLTISFEFTADSGLTTLRYLDVNSNNGLASDIILDSVSVTVVPEPSTALLLGLGLGLVGLAARRRV